MFRNACISIDCGVGGDIEHFPAADVIAVKNTWKVEFLEERVLTNPRHNLILKRPASQNSSCINDATNR